MLTTDDTAFLAALQLADSALPIGRFVHSHGLESWLTYAPDATAQEIADLALAVVEASVATLDGVILAHAHSARTLGELVALDRLLTARKLIPSAREASQRPGGRLAALALEFTDDELCGGFVRLVQGDGTDGNLAVVEGVLGRALGLSARQTVLLELRGVASGLLSAAVRLGRMTPTYAQLAMQRSAPRLATAAAGTLERTLEQTSSSIPCLELHALRHHRSAMRFFAT